VDNEINPSSTALTISNCLPFLFYLPTQPTFSGVKGKEKETLELAKGWVGIVINGMP